MYMNNEEYISIPVPRHLVVGVYAWIAAQGGNEERPQARTATRVEETGWSAPLLVRMVEESPIAMKYILKLLAENAETELPTRELARALIHKPEADSLTVAGTLGAFGRRCKNRYQQDKWPFKVRWDEGHQSCFYKMSRETAAIILNSFD